MRMCLCLVVLVAVGLNSTSARQKKQGPSTSQINRTTIQGIWWSKEWPQSAAFQVNDSTFYYPDEFISRKYRIGGDSLFLFLEEGDTVRSLIVKLSSDTLILLTNGTKALYTKTEPKE